MPAGRPTKYTDFIIPDTEQYLKDCIENGKLPSIARLSTYLKVTRSTLYEWKETHPEFSDILEAILAEQEACALEKGLEGDWNPTIVKLLLGKHGYSDSKQITGADGKDLIPSEVIITHE